MVRHALNAKDIGALDNLDGEIGEISRKLLFAAGSAKKAMEIIGGLSLPVEAQNMCDELKKLVPAAEGRGTGS